jgi:hypothetical protein
MMRKGENKMGKKDNKLPNIYEGSNMQASGICNDQIAQHNLTIGKKWREAEMMLPSSPPEIATLIRQYYPKCWQSSIYKLCLMLSEAYTISRKQKKNGEGCFEASNEWAEGIASRIQGMRPLKLLCQAKLIEPVATYRAKIRPKAITYRFKIPIESFKSYTITLTGKAAEKSLDSGRRAQKRREKDPVYSWVDESLKRVGLSEFYLKNYQQRPNHESNSAKFAKGEREHRWNWAYRTNLVGQMPSDLRPKLHFDGDVSVMPLDISSSFGTMLPWLFEEDTKNAYSKGKITLHEKMLRKLEAHRLRSFLSEDDFLSENYFSGNLVRKPRMLFRDILIPRTLML